MAYIPNIVEMVIAPINGKDKMSKPKHIPAIPIIIDHPQGRPMRFISRAPTVWMMPTVMLHSAKIMGRLDAVIPRLETKMRPTTTSSAPTSKYQPDFISMDENM